MSTLVNHVASKINSTCIAKKIQTSNCKVFLTRAPKPNLIIDMDKPEAPLKQSRVRCDYLFFAEAARKNHGWFVPLEIKAGSPKIRGVAKQLQATTKVVERQNLIPANIQINFIPVLVCKLNGLNRHTLKEIRKESYKIQFSKKKEPIRLLECGGQLSDVL